MWTKETKKVLVKLIFLNRAQTSVGVRSMPHYRLFLLSMALKTWKLIQHAKLFQEKTFTRYEV